MAWDPESSRQRIERVDSTEVLKNDSPMPLKWSKAKMQGPSNATVFGRSNGQRTADKKTQCSED